MPWAEFKEPEKYRKNAFLQEKNKQTKKKSELLWLFLLRELKSLYQEFSLYYIFYGSTDYNI